VSKVFAFLRSKLNAKEKELLELQRAEPCLLAPDSKQIDTLLDVISSLHLSTQEGSFIFASTSNADDSSSTSVCSTGIESIKTLPSTIWLPESTSLKQEKEQQNEYRLPMVTHLLSLPLNAYVASSSNRSILPSFDTNNQPANRLPMVSQLFAMPISAFKSSSNNESTPVEIEEKKETYDQPSNRLPMVSQLLSMPISAFKSSSNNESKPVEIEEKKETVNNNNHKIASTTEPPKSILNTETIYSKEHWLRKCPPSESESVPLDLDAYIEQSTDKMRRLHMEYLEALEKLKTPLNPIDPSQMIKSMYPQMFDRIQQDMSTKDLTRLLPSNK